MKIKKVFAYFGLAILPVLLVYSFWRKSQLANDFSYTITVTERQISTLKNGLKIEHIYYVNGKRYKMDYSKDERLNIIYPGGRYLVKFSTDHPSISEVLWNKPVPDSIKSSPSDGWKKLPF